MSGLASECKVGRERVNPWGKLKGGKCLFFRRGQGGLMPEGGPTNREKSNLGRMGGCSKLIVKYVGSRLVGKVLGGPPPRDLARLVYHSRVI